MRILDVYDTTITVCNYLYMDIEESNNNCLKCGKKLSGRSDKKFCDVFCKSGYHYRKSLNEDEFYHEVTGHLRTNRKILKLYNRAGKATVRSEVLSELGFNPRFFTHYWKNKKGDVYFFVYEYGFLRRNENGKEKFVPTFI